MTDLFSPLTLRGLTLRNRIGIPPMCQYSADTGTGPDGTPLEGLASDWHLVHYGARAAGGAGLLIQEATAVEARGRISPGDLGLWSDAQVAPLARIVRFVKGQGAAAAIQLAHAGRKASHPLGWEGGGMLPLDAGGWPVVAPSAIPFAPDGRAPAAMTGDDIATVVAAFRAAAARSHEAGFDLVELHAAHGYLGHSFLSPLTNRREDRWGGSFEGRTRFVLEVLRAIRQVWPDGKPVAVRISCTDWVEGGWTVEDSVALARLLKQDGADLVDCSSGGLVPDAKIPAAPMFQVPFAHAVRTGAGVATAAVGLITRPEDAAAIVSSGQADLVLLGREELRDPQWPIRAARFLGRPAAVRVPPQYLRAYP